MEWKSAGRVGEWVGMSRGGGKEKETVRALERMEIGEKGRKVVDVVGSGDVW